MDWFLYDNGLRHERVKIIITELGSGEEGVCQRNSLASYEGERGYMCVHVGTRREGMVLKTTFGFVRTSW